ncbi:MAG: glycosyltransferase family 39 protein [Myxococcaceae bacterium]|nr:glycosyltransferase family 39 protein [Myxococcaceae bacterium]
MTPFEPVREKERADTVIAWVLFTGAFAVLWATQRAIGFPRDESFYFYAAQNHAGWFELLFSHPSRALEDGSITRFFDYNHEHPALMKNLFGLSWLLFHKTLGWLPPAAAFRIPALLVASAIAPMVYRMGSAVYGRAAGLFAAISFFLVPRQFFNSHLAAFDVPVAAAWLFVVYAFWRAQHHPGWFIGCGIAFGLGLATKHNTFFVPVVLAPFALYLAWKHSRHKPEARAWAVRLVALYLAVAVAYALLFLFIAFAPPGNAPRIVGDVRTDAFIERFTLLSPATLLYGLAVAGTVWILVRLRRVDEATFRPLAAGGAMLVLGPPVLYLCWPYLWHHPVQRVAWWINFHAQHNHYAWFYLGRLLREPPFPLEYVVAVTAMTVPVSLFAPMALGFFTALGRLGAVVLRRSGWARAADWQDALWVANAFASIALISLPSVPHFGGVKHWFPSMPFLGVLGGMVIANASAWVVERLRARRTLTRPAMVAWALTGGVMALLFAPALVASVRIHPYGTAFYSEVAGGVPGGATLGMQRQFWSSHITGVLPWLNENAPQGARVWLHEVTGLAFRDYQENGTMRTDLRGFEPRGPSADEIRAGADFAAYQYHQEFREHEMAIWEAFGTTRPETGLYVDETPQVLLYRNARR